MLGAMLGDIIGEPYEFDRGDKKKPVELFTAHPRFTDDTVMTFAVADSLLGITRKLPDMKDDKIKALVQESLLSWGHMYPLPDYGGRFAIWLHSEKPRPYGSYGNGSAMRVSSVGWLFDSLEETRRIARLTAEVTHNHPEGIKGAEAVATLIWLGRTGQCSKADIREYVENEFGYDLSRTCDEIRPDYYHIESCQATVPEAITAFLEGEDFEDVIRTAVSLGGDSDTLTCIAGSIAEAFYPIPEWLMKKAIAMMDTRMFMVYMDFVRNKKTGERN